MECDVIAGACKVLDVHLLAVNGIDLLEASVCALILNRVRGEMQGVSRGHQSRVKGARVVGNVHHAGGDRIPNLER